jgi:hypothetical protein
MDCVLFNLYVTRCRYQSQLAFLVVGWMMNFGRVVVWHLFEVGTLSSAGCVTVAVILYHVMRLVFVHCFVGEEVLLS